jgi:hypothetical protein
MTGSAWNPQRAVRLGSIATPAHSENFADSLDRPSDESAFGKPMPGPLSVYGPVTQWNWQAARDLLLRYKAAYQRDFIRLWIAHGPEFRRAVEEEFILVFGILVPSQFAASHHTGQLA